MAFTVFQGGSNLYGLNAQGATVQLALPSGVTIDSTLRPRFAVFGNYVVVVNSPSRPLTVDANLNVRVLCPNPPTAKMTLSGVTSGALSGTFQARQTFVVRDAFGAIIAESDFGPTADAVTISSKMLRAAGINLSQDKVTASRLYRTTTGTSVYFRWIDLDGNTQTTIEDDLSDAGLSTLSAPSLGTPPDMYLLAEFRSRLFGVSKANKEAIAYSEVGAMYAWPSDNTQPIPRVGSDARGVTGFVRRRDALGIGRSNGFYQFTGTDDTNFRIVNVSENCGIESNDTVGVFRDTAWWLWKDGVYQWNSDGLKCISDGKVRRWFTQNDTFNLSRFQYAFAHVDPIRHKYRLFLASAGSQVENCWIEYDFLEDKWWGPHTSHAMIPSAAFQFSYDSGLSVPMYGGRDGYCRQERKQRFDDTDTPIDFDVVTARDDAGMPTKEKMFGHVFVSSKPQAQGGELVVQAAVGEIDQLRTAKDIIGTADLTNGFNRVDRVGQGKAYKLRFRNHDSRVDVNLRGYEIPDVHLVGQR